MGLGTSAVLIVGFATSTSVHAEEWRVVNGKEIKGSAWRIAEVEFFAKADCTQKLNVVQGSAYVEPFPGDQVWASQVLHEKDDCWDACQFKAGLCSWCGEGNACCRRGFTQDPLVCRGAMAFQSDHHECVAVSSSGPLQQPAAQRALDGKVSTMFDVPCQGCPPGSLTIGAVLPDVNVPVRCIAISEPDPSSAKGGLPAEVLIQLADRSSGSGGGGKMAPCPGLCRSGRYLEGNGKAPCTQWLSLHGWCGPTPLHRAGVDCRTCQLAPVSWKDVPFRVVKRDAVTGDGATKVILWKLAVQAEEIRPPPHDAPVAPPQRVQHVGEDCWSQCSEGLSGYCNWCGIGNACCKKDFGNDPAECRRAISFTSNHHECVELELEHKGEDCWGRCGASGSSGNCPWCGPGNACCKNGFPSDPPECKRALSFSTNHHECVRVAPEPFAVLPKPGPPASAARGPEAQPAVKRSNHVAPSPPPPPPPQPQPQPQSPPQPPRLGAQPRPAPVPAPPPPPPPPRPPPKPEVVPAPVLDGAKSANSEPAPARRTEGSSLVEDCWGKCTEGSSGRCDSFCGHGRACCKQSSFRDPEDCQRAYGFVVDYHQCVDLTPLPGESGFQTDSFKLAGIAFLASWGAACGAFFCLCKRKGPRPYVPPPVENRSLEGDHDYMRRRQRQQCEEFNRHELREKATQLHWFA